ncbi:hypothetical protein BSYN_21670 [Bacteroides sedimenti]|uniref:Uncharacterized protein n=2 Tax=Bacteroides sedimenti TaxID=2136147 RepID=A0ABN6Z841_9BACE
MCWASKSQQTNNKQLLVAGKDVVKPKARISKGGLIFREWNINKDTLELISVDDFLAFPFGSYKKINDLQVRFKGLKYKEVVDSHDPKGTTKLNKFFVGNNYIKFIFLKDVFSDMRRSRLFLQTLMTRKLSYRKRYR